MPPTTDFDRPLLDGWPGAPTQEDHFALDVDPESLRRAARTMDRVAEEFGRRATRIAAQPGKVGSAWTGKAARATKDEMRGLASHLDDFARDLAETRRAVRKLARAYDAGIEAVQRLNARWVRADERYDRALEKAAEEYEERVASGGHASLGMEFDPTYTRAKGDARATLAARRGELEKAFDELRQDLRADTRTCARSVEERVPLPVVPTQVAAYRSTGYVGLRSQRSDFTDDLPLSRAARAAGEASEVSGTDTDAPPLVDAWDAASLGEVWAKKMGEWYSKALDEAGEVAASRKAATFARRVPLIGNVITVAGVGHDIQKGKSPGRTILSAGAGVAVTAIVAGSVTVGAPVLLVAAGAVALGVGASFVVEKTWDWVDSTEWGHSVTTAIDEGAKKLGTVIAGGAKSAWKAIF